MATPNYRPNVGALVTNRYDFENHIEGTAFRHNAIQIDVNPPVSIQGVQYITVADALNALAGFATQNTFNGSGFIAIGDGYDTYHASDVPTTDNVTNASNTTPIVITAASSISLLTGQSVTVSGVGGNTAANGTFIVTVVDATHFSLNGSAGNGTYTSGGIFNNPHPNQSFPFDSTTPPLDAALNDLLNNVNNPLHHRIRDGGIVLIKAGTYIITNTVSVPPGIVLLGEGYGTKLVNQTSPPAPMFSILPDTNDTADFGVTHGNPDPNGPFMFSKDVAFLNLTIADNFVEPKFLGDMSYLTPQNVPISFGIMSSTNTSPIQITTTATNSLVTGNLVTISNHAVNTNANGTWVITVLDNLHFTLNNSTGTGSPGGATGNVYSIQSPLISQKEGSSLICDNVRFLGKVSYSTGKPSITTGGAIGTDSTLPLPTPVRTSLFVRNSMFDGFEVPISQTSSGNVNDYLYCTKNKIRCFGSAFDTYGANAPAVPIRMNTINASINDNYIFTNFVDSAVYNAGFFTGPAVVLVPNTFPSVTTKLNNVIANNNVTSFGALGPSIPTAINFVLFQTSPSNATITATLNMIMYGNTDLTNAFSISHNPSLGGTGPTSDFFVQNTTGFPNTVNVGTTAIVNTVNVGASTVVNNIAGSQTWTTRSIAGNLVIDTTTRDLIVLTDTSAPRTITLPAPTNGRIIVIKDTTGTAETNHITIAQHASELIEGVAASYTFASNWGSLFLCSNGTNWFVIAGN